MKKSDRYVLAGLWTLVGVDLIWFFVSGLNIYAFMWFFLLVAAAMAWWGLRFPITEKMRAKAIFAVGGFWVVLGFLLFYPFSPPAKPNYIVGEVHRFSEMEHGFARAFMGAVGPTLAFHGMVYTPMPEIEGLGQYHARPSFVTTFPWARAMFGGTTLMDDYRAPDTLGGDPVKPTPFPWTTWKGPAREKKLGWNRGDILLADVAHTLGYEKARYTPEENALMIKEMARWMGSMQVAIAKVDPRWFYSHDMLTAGTPLDLKDVKDYKYAIQVFTDQDWKRVHNDPGESWWSLGKSGQACPDAEGYGLQGQGRVRGRKLRYH